MWFNKKDYYIFDKYRITLNSNYEGRDSLFILCWDQKKNYEILVKYMIYLYIKKKKIADFSRVSSRTRFLPSPDPGEYSTATKSPDQSREASYGCRTGRL